MANLKALARNVKIEAEYYGVPEDKDFPNSTPWKITLKYKGRKLTTPFYTGSFITEEPTSYDVLYCLISDAASVEWDNFEAWCDNLGYDQDSRKAEQTYKQCEQIAVKLSKFLGDDYDTFTNAEQD